MLAVAVPALLAFLQCPDGSAPPCGRPVARAPIANSVAVLYFEARDTADVYLADGLTEDVATLLGGTLGVLVKPPSVVRRAQRATPQNYPAIARTLSVRYLVDGSVRRSAAGLSSSSDAWIARGFLLAYADPHTMAGATVPTREICAGRWRTRKARIGCSPVIRRWRGFSRSGAIGCLVHSPRIDRTATS